MASSPTASDEPLAAAVLLGWRVAELYALVDDTGIPASDTLLPAHGSLEPADQLELQLRAACGDARRAGVTSEGAALDALVALARAAPGSAAEAETFRAQLRSCHIEVQKDLWALDEAAGKAYELGNGLSDTYGRVCRAYRRDGEEPSETWEQVFLPARIERLKRLLDDLQSRLNAGGVAVVRAQLDAWCAGVQARLRTGEAPSEELVRDGVRRQTVIWRQLLAGDKAPDAYLDRHARAGLRDDLRRLIWRRYRRWSVVLGAALFALVLALPHLISAYETGFVRTGLASALVAIAGAVGITKVSILLTVRGRLDQWAQLLWDRALVQRVVEATLTLDSVLPPPARRMRGYGVLSNGGPASPRRVEVLGQAVVEQHLHVGRGHRPCVVRVLGLTRPEPERIDAASGGGGVRRGDGQAIGAVVERLVRVRRARLVPANPVPAHLGVAGELGLEGEHQVLVLDRVAARGLPAPALPAGDPLRHRVEHQAGVRDDADAAAGRQRPQALDRGRELHAVVRRVRGAAVQLERRLSVRRHDDRGPAAGAGVAAAGAVGPHQRLPGTGLDRGLGEAGGAAADGWHGARS